MESWSYVSEPKGFVSEESVSASDGIARSKNGFGSWEFKTQCSFGSNTIYPSQQSIGNQGFVEFCCQESMRKSLANDSVRDVMNSKVDGKVFHPVTATSSSFFGEEESTSRLSSSIVESNCRDSSLIDLKLGRLSDHREANNSSSKVAPILSSAESALPAKRARAGGLSSQTPLCQVHGCRKDLSSSKDYHKRHKVCEVHSKTAKVIVNGIEQRFCQQCSRFHLLAEFDDGKRSCRKRLAGHNERRRKPHLGLQSGRAGRLFPSYNGNRFQGTTFATSSFVCQDILPNGFPHPHKYEVNDWYWHVKVEDGADYSRQLAMPLTHGSLHPKPPFASYNSEKQCSPLLGNGMNAVTRNKIDDNTNSFLHNLMGTDFNSSSLFHNNPIESDVLTVLDSSSTVQGLSGISNCGRALSLLSSQSNNSSDHSSGIPTAKPLVTSGNHIHYSVTQMSEKLLGISPQASTSGISNPFQSSGINSTEETRLEQLLISDGNDTVSYGISGIIQGPEYMNAKNHLSYEDGTTINLLQLSSRLRQVERQRQSMQAKQENDNSHGLRIT